MHLVSGAGASIFNKGEQWNRIEGEFRHYPIGIRKMGEIAQSGEAHKMVNLDKDADWVARSERVFRDKIKGYAGQPLLCKGEALGVLAIFSRTRLLKESVFRLRWAKTPLSCKADSNVFTSRGSTNVWAKKSPVRWMSA